MTPNWQELWVMIQEMGAVLQPVLDSDDPPEWAARLREALDAAEEGIPDDLPAEQEARDAG